MRGTKLHIRKRTLAVGKYAVTARRNELALSILLPGETFTVLVAQMKVLHHVFKAKVSKGSDNFDVPCGEPRFFEIDIEISSDDGPDAVSSSTSSNNLGAGASILLTWRHVCTNQ